MAVSSPGGRNTKSTHLQLQTGSREVEPDMGGCFKLPGRPPPPPPVTQFLQDRIPSKPPQVAAILKQYGGLSIKPPRLLKHQFKNMGQRTHCVPLIVLEFLDQELRGPAPDTATTASFHLNLRGPEPYSGHRSCEFSPFPPCFGPAGKRRP